MKQTPRSRSVCCRATIAAMGAALGACLSAASHAQEAPPPVAPPVVTDSLLPPLPPPPLVPSDSAPLAGYTNGTFFLRSPSNNFVLFPDGRLNVDGYFFPARPDAPAGVTADGPADPRPKNTFNVRRARAEFSGQLLQHFNYYMGGEFGTIPGGAQYGTFTDVFINVDYTPWANLQIGQFDAPFTLENRTSDKYFDFLERSVAVRGVGVPLNKELGAMLWGLAPRKYLYYSVGVFNGDGIDVKDIDNHFDVMGRAYLAPLAFLRASETTRWLTEIWVGGSAWYSTHVLSPFLMPAVTTQGGFTLLPGSFAANALNLGYNGDAFKWAVELNAPIGPFGLRFELVRIDHEGLGLYDKPLTQADRRPVAQLSRSATAFYVQAWYWIVGDYRMIPAPGQELPRKWAGYKPELGRWQLGLNVTAKYEHMQLNIAQDDSATLTDAQGAVLGGMTLDVAEVGANLWLSRHLRAQANYVMNYLSGDMKLAQSNPCFRTAEHELLLRMAVGL